MQILTVADLLGGKGIDMPQTRVLRTFKKAPKAKRAAHEQPDLPSKADG